MKWIEASDKIDGRKKYVNLEWASHIIFKNEAEALLYASASGPHNLIGTVEGEVAVANLERILKGD